MLDDAIKGDFIQTLRTGGYSLILGAGVTSGCSGPQGQLPMGNALRKEICEIVDAKADSSLARVFQVLEPNQIKSLITDRYSNCSPSQSLKELSRYLWKRIYTFNVDDCLENAYARVENPKQTPISINYLDPYKERETPREVQIIHLHGYARKPFDKYVFSITDYGKNMADNNPWMHVLGDSFTSGPFIIAGASLEEYDLKYYVKDRGEATPQTDRAPTLLIEPHADGPLRKECEAKNIVLIESTFEAFTKRLRDVLPVPLTTTQLLVPEASEVFSAALPPNDRIDFYNDFELVESRELGKPSKPTSPYIRGYKPTLDDVYRKIDVPRHHTGPVLSSIQRLLADDAHEKNIVVFRGIPGAGATTMLLRIGVDLASGGVIVFRCKAMRRLNVDAVVKCLRVLTDRAVLLFDDIGGHTEQINELLSEDVVRKNVVIVGSSRNYRWEPIRDILGNRIQRSYQVPTINRPEARQLISIYQNYGMAAARETINSPDRFADTIAKSSFAIAVCRILNDFRSIDEIAASLWTDSSEALRRVYSIVALSQYCHGDGVLSSIVQKVVGPHEPVSRFINKPLALPIRTNPNEPQYLLPESTIVAERTLHFVSEKDSDGLFNTFVQLANNLAPYVNRTTIKQRTPEAQMARRLFDYDHAIAVFIQDRGEEFYEKTQKAWQWNSRYWEQRAILAANDDIELGVQHARYAVSLEEHQYPLTTLARLLFRLSNSTNPPSNSIRSEAMSYILKALDLERSRHGVTRHPYLAAIDGNRYFVEHGGTMSDTDFRIVDDIVDDAKLKLGGRSEIDKAIKRWDRIRYS